MTLAPKYATNKKSTIFYLSSWNFVKMTITWVGNILESQANWDKIVHFLSVVHFLGCVIFFVTVSMIQSKTCNNKITIMIYYTFHSYFEKKLWQTERYKSGRAFLHERMAFKVNFSSSLWILTDLVFELERAQSKLISPCFSRLLKAR